eukprot:TRINITY_DN6068_c0_g1_i2.p1 TRINITY_DN6068_c0_g1~~TRINITY_DN6068_c0_g1_i2.p1  ORF type:complete len:306 (-),score=86.32 TRINITY_DN6068_c0_g1_i2:206-1123(-)
MALRQAVKNSSLSSILKPQVNSNAVSIAKITTPALNPSFSVTQRFFTTKVLSQSRAATFLATRSICRSDQFTIQSRGFAKQPVPVKKNDELEKARTELIAEIKNRIEDIQNNFEENDDHFLAETGFKLTKKDDEIVTLRREVDGFVVEVAFRPGDATIPGEDESALDQLPEGEGELEGEAGELQGENNAEEGDVAEDEDFPDYSGSFLNFEISVQSKTKTGELRTLSAECEIDVYGLIHVLGFTFDRKDNVEITENISAGLKEYFGKLGVDEEKFVPYVWDYCRSFHDKTELNRLTALQQFLEKK